jgi:hypothetical protein
MNGIVETDDMTGSGELKPQHAAKGNKNRATTTNLRQPKVENSGDR